MMETEVSRIEAALARIEAGATRHFREQDRLVQRHAALREAMEQAVGALDTLATGDDA